MQGGEKDMPEKILTDTNDCLLMKAIGIFSLVITPIHKMV